MSRVSYLLVLLSLVTSNIYITESYTLTASVLAQLGYNAESWLISIEDNNIDSIDLNAFNGFNMLFGIGITSTNLLKIDLEVFKNTTNIESLFLKTPSLNKFTNTKNVKFPYLTSLLLYTNLTSLNKPMFNAFPALIQIRTGEYSIGYGNSLKTVDVHTFESLSNFSYLDLQLNSLTGFEYLQIPKNLRTLNLAGNKMNYFALSRTMGVLYYLDISNNLFRSFKSMDFTFLANLTELYLQNNPHAYPNEISGHMKPLVKLEQVDLRNLSINTIDTNFFKTNTKLKRVDLRYNKISSLDSGAFKGLNNLESILLVKNNLTKISSGTFNISNYVAIDLTDNQISQLEESSFIGFEGTHVYLNANKLTKIRPRTFINKFTNIFMQGNQITEIENTTFDGATKIGYLAISSNKIEKIAPGSFNNLGINGIDLSFNLLTELRNGSFTGQIEGIFLGNNRIEKIEEGAFNYANITASLRLENNRLTEINSTMFAGQNRLWYIDLSYNKLSTIEPGSFANLPKLNYVYLKNNQLTQLDSSIFAGSNNLLGIYLNGNPDLSTTNIQSLCPPSATQCQVYY